MKFFKKRKFYIRDYELFSDEFNLVEVTLREKLVDIYQEYFHYPVLMRAKRIYQDNFGEFLYRVNKLRDWIPLLWREDFDWDYMGILLVLKKKLERMVPVFRDGYHTTSSKSLKEIQTCIYLLDRILYNNYDVEAMEYLDKKYGKLKFTRTESRYSTIERQFPDGMEKKYERDSTRAYAEADVRAKQDLELLFKIMNRKMKSWWE